MKRNERLRILLYGSFYLLLVSLHVLITTGPLSQRIRFSKLIFDDYLIFRRTDFLNPLLLDAGYFQLSLL